ncbi:cytochrome P450 [Sulfitobacter sp. PR48]|uniref:cytochrome P450 n=1 Tax=Sulfitobacter sp. PR48 TaxID=3028383 RepID=UPI00237A6477|nr:cytochrome P450 [Sulfitobacter sp. PR48]MDD9721072.1 cytochrome P450 [Sulfitobacter sp. PR48]
MTEMIQATRPSVDTDLYADDVIRDPYPVYQKIRDTAPAVWLPENDLWAIGRFDDAVAALAANEILISSKGVAANPRLNAITTPNILMTDAPEHRPLRKVISQPVMPTGLAEVKPRIQETAQQMIDTLVQRKEFDGMTDLAQILPLTIVSELLGLPEFGRQNMLKWAAATFDALGGDNARAEDAFPTIMELRAFCADDVRRDTVRPGSWVARLFEAVDEGSIDPSLVPMFTRDYIAPSLDTTIFATGHLMHQLGNAPDQWEKLRANPALIPNAINEAVRLESPIRGFTRYAKEDYDVDGVTIPKGERVLILYASANRDERRWTEPDRFDVERKVSDHVGFGHGIHMCMGAQLARLEMRSILQVMVEKVARIEVGEPEFELNNVLRGFRSLPMKFVPL